MRLDRRSLVGGVLATALCHQPLAAAAGRDIMVPQGPVETPRARVILVNDLSGDVDGIFAAVHAVLSPSIDLRAIVGTATGARRETASASAAVGAELLRMLGRTGRVPIHAGAPARLSAPGIAARSPGIQAIIDEALRTDTTLPLYLAVGGGLTEVASALLLQPSIAERLTLIWIGGTANLHPSEPEYNFRIDPVAAQHVFNDSSVPLWQVPREAYATCVVSVTEMRANVAPCGMIGRWLVGQLLAARARFAQLGMNTGETWTLGDSPLVLLTALTDWVPTRAGRTPRYEATGSSRYAEIAAPVLDARGIGTSPATGRMIRIYQTVDTRLMLDDFYAKLRLHSNSLA